MQTANLIHIESGVTSLGTSPMKIEMCEGVAWITHNTDDIAIRAGEIVELSATQYPILIAAVDDRESITFKMMEMGKKSPSKVSSITTMLLNILKG